MAIALGCGFVARALASDVDHTAELMWQAIAHKGFALVDILQPCVTFNRKNSYQWYGKMAYKVPADHDPTDRQKAFALSLEWDRKDPRRDPLPAGATLLRGRAPRRGGAAAARPGNPA